MGNSRTKGARFTVMLVVLLAHFLLLMLFDFGMRSIRKIDRMPITLLTFMKVQREKPYLDIKMNSNFTSVDHAITVPNVTLDISAATNSALSVSPTIDWETEGTPSTVREFGRSIHQQTPAAIEPPSVFTQPPHRFGDITKTPNGDDIVWLSRNCYQVANSDADHFKSFATGMPDTDKNTVSCRKSIGQSQGNAHMFDHLKPEYLKRPVEDICSKTVAGCNHSSSSSTH